MMHDWLKLDKHPSPYQKKPSVSGAEKNPKNPKKKKFVQLRQSQTQRMRIFSSNGTGRSYY